MKTSLGELENNEAILLMYLTGELPLEERVEVDQMLQRDSALRRQCEQMRRLLERTADDFAIEAAKSPLPSLDSARDRLRPVMRQWATDRLMRPKPAAQARRAPWFLYPLVGTAAALVLIAMLLSQMEPAREIAPGPLVLQTPDWRDTSEEPETGFTVASLNESELVMASLAAEDPLNTYSEDSLAQARSELQQIQLLADAMAKGADLTYFQ
jgi:anti-sigma factor RsiW